MQGVALALLGLLPPPCLIGCAPVLAADAALAAAPTPAPVWHLLVAVLVLLASALAALTPGARAPSNRILES